MRIVGIVGLGLMGGAIAIALREKCGISQTNLFACDRDAEALCAAQEQEIISRGYAADSANEMLSVCDVVFLCLNPSAVLRFLEQWQSAFKPGCIVTDIAGTKSSIAAAAEKLRADIDFIPGHPMAGSHTPGNNKGFTNSRLVDFSGKNYILTPLARNKKENIDYLKNLIHQMGFAHITEVSAEEHDRKIAFTSQLCHVIASALIDCETDTAITRFGGGSFEDLTRIAMLNAPMWTEIFIENRGILLERINQFEASLDKLKALIGEANTVELEKVLACVRERRTQMNN